jgi:hypothetical protein
MTFSTSRNSYLSVNGSRGDDRVAAQSTPQDTEIFTFLEIIMLLSAQHKRHKREAQPYYTQTPGQIESLVSAVIDSLSVHSIAGARHATQGGRSKAARGTYFLLQACFLFPCLLQPSVRHARGPRPPPPTLEVVSPPRPASTAVLRHRDPSRRFQMMLQRAGLVPSHPPVAHTLFTVLPELFQCKSASPLSRNSFSLCASDRNPLCVGGPADGTLAGAGSSHIVRGSRRLIERARCHVMLPPHRLQPGGPTNARSRVSLSN